ncbi:hypothetical protein [Pseudalkalibacillus salsuginis]|uniref:hypothetical protein n=1 Tax=Pseudalkalibacillus salsuginis TaxID=2910972 RepID=UPI001F46B12A|nr:hypothetical protein [Pseudalkalibacillus salsuginis]MCF6411966.1 hypothetical protein [Pseudalkalibacillus salsuginis]
MKKLLAFSMLFLLVFAAACGNDDSATGTKDESEKKVDKTELKSTLLDFQLEVTDVLKENHKPFAEFEAIKAQMNDSEVAEEEKPSKEEAQSALDAAKEAGPKAAEALRGMEIPSELSQYEEDLQSALEDAAKSYEKRAETVSLEAAEDAQAEADELFASFEEKFSKPFENLDLLSPKFKTELE